MNLRGHAPNVWSMTQDISLMPGFVLSATGLVVRLESGGVIVISPLPKIAEFADEVRALGPVVAVVAPNLAHHLSVPKAMALFPEARVWGSPSLQAKRADITFTDALTPEARPWGDELVPIFVNGMPKLNETVFFHRPTGVLYLVDIAFNIERPKQWLGRLILGAVGAYGRFGPPRVGFKPADKAAFRKTIDELVALKPKQLLVSHGVPVTENATEVLARAFA